MGQANNTLLIVGFSRQAGVLHGLACQLGVSAQQAKLLGFAGVVDHLGQRCFQVRQRLKGPCSKRFVVDLVSQVVKTKSGRKYACSDACRCGGFLVPGATLTRLIVTRSDCEFSGQISCRTATPELVSTTDSPLRYISTVRLQNDV